MHDISLNLNMCHA